MKRLTKQQVLLLHQQLLDQFGGTAGIRDEGLLDSALSTPFQTFGGHLFIRPSRSKQLNLDSALSAIILLSTATSGLARMSCWSF
jgi:death-on-curing protein